MILLCDKPEHKTLLGDLEILSNHFRVISQSQTKLAPIIQSSSGYGIHKLLMFKLYPVLAAFVEWVTDGNGR